MKKTLIIHPYLFAVFPVLFLYSHNIEQLTFSDTLFPMGILLGSVILIVLFSRIIFKNYQKAGLIISFFLILFYTYGHVYDVIKDWQIGNFEIGRHRYLLLIYTTFYACCFYFITRASKNLSTTNNFLNIVAASLLTISLINIGFYKFKTMNEWRGEKSYGQSNIPIYGEDTAEFRDIYYIILDGYGSSNILKEYYGYDNTEFIDYLKDKGFFIASGSRSNYVMTTPSLASSLNMEYVHFLASKEGVESNNRSIFYQMIKKSKIVDFLKMKGYKYIHFSSGWGPTDYNKYADFNVRCSKVNEFVMILFQTTILRPLENYIVGDDARNRILCTFTKLAEINNIKGPKFVFAHITSPHPPYLFDANGEPVPEITLNLHKHVWEQKENYLSQLNFINKKVETLIDTILSKSEVLPIIILQADHGPASTLSQSNGRGWEQPTNPMLKERTGILNAYYLPSDMSKFLYDSITPVNTFRIILNNYFKMTYTLLNDQIFYSTYEDPLKFVNTTQYCPK